MVCSSIPTGGGFVPSTVLSDQELSKIGIRTASKMPPPPLICVWVCVFGVRLPFLGSCKFQGKLQHTPTESPKLGKCGPARLGLTPAPVTCASHGPWWMFANLSPSQRVPGMQFKCAPAVRGTFDICAVFWLDSLWDPGQPSTNKSKQYVQVDLPLWKHLFLDFLGVRQWTLRVTWPPNFGLPTSDSAFGATQFKNAPRLERRTGLVDPLWHLSIGGRKKCSENSLNSGGQRLVSAMIELRCAREDRKRKTTKQLAWWCGSNGQKSRPYSPFPQA